ncbi:DUF4136 domain-containing protein [Piscinibacter sakaiensis]|uniref:Putative lipoprotein transmembrane n=1 Tax=Piscinibacter sakaiensis TaxID=1547922 RepID=A0A0K8P530_PISS1|nr:DUF4136 domain-containing protein [Piscinibacter sakaiensis]GAP37747.1 putative lipoprotein transmembrane [Piscinibacter sakaiensis]
MSTLFRWPALLLSAALLGGCASMTQLGSEVSSYGSWPAERRPAAFVFDRLPSQQREPSGQDLLEAAALPALQAAGFTPATDPATATYTVQLGARVTEDPRSLDPWFGPRGWYGPPRPRLYGWYGWPGWGRFGPGFYGPATPVYDREVVVLIRDRRSGEIVYETRASNSGMISSIQGLLPAMFAAALKDFPAVEKTPRRVVVPIGS